MSRDVKHSRGNLYGRFSQKSRAGRKANVLAAKRTRSHSPLLFSRAALYSHPVSISPRRVWLCNSTIENRRRCRHRRRRENRVRPVDTASWNETSRTYLSHLCVFSIVSTIFRLLFLPGCIKKNVYIGCMKIRNKEGTKIVGKWMFSLKWKLN